MALSVKLTEYELERQRQVERNRQKLKELGVLEIKDEISKSTVKAKQPRLKKPKSIGLLLPERRSARVSSKPRPSYRFMDTEVKPTNWRNSNSTGNNRSLPRGEYSPEAMREAVEACEAMALTLKYPCLLKTVMPSQMSGGFWMGLNANFCRDHLPKTDAVVILENSDGVEWETIYKADKGGLSGGWRGFAIDNQLDSGDVLLFELTETTRLKVHIFRARDQKSSKRAGIQESGIEEMVNKEYQYEKSVYAVKAKASNEGRSGKRKAQIDEDMGGQSYGGEEAEKKVKKKKSTEVVSTKKKGKLLKKGKKNGGKSGKNQVMEEGIGGEVEEDEEDEEKDVKTKKFAKKKTKVTFEEPENENEEKEEDDKDDKDFEVSKEENREDGDDLQILEEKTKSPGSNGRAQRAYNRKILREKMM